MLAKIKTWIVANPLVSALIAAPVLFFLFKFIYGLLTGKKGKSKW